MHKGKLLILGLIPKSIREGTATLGLFWKYIRSMYRDFLPIIENGDVQFGMNKIEKLFMGLLHPDNLERDFLFDYSERLLILTRFFTSSVGPRKGDFFEELIGNWLSSSGYLVYKNAVLRDTLKKELHPRTWKEDWDKTLGDSKLDFFLKKDRILSLVELRTSEDTGGKTSQQSLLDKFNGFLTLVKDESFSSLLKDASIEMVKLVIETVFSERDKNIVTVPNQGRLRSLVNYITKEEHLYGKIRNLLGELSQDEFEQNLINKREFKFAYFDLDFSVRLMYGNEFFKEYLGKDLEELLDTEEIPDDVWLLYTMAVNELLRFKLSDNGKTLTKQIFDILINRAFDEVKELFEQFEKADQQCNSASPNYLDCFVNLLDNLTNQIRQLILNLIEKNNIKLQILPTEDFQKSYRYLKYISYCILLLGTTKLSKHCAQRRGKQDRNVCRNTHLEGKKQDLFSNTESQSAE